MNAVVNATTEKTWTEKECAAYKKAVAELKTHLKGLAVWQRYNKLLLKERQRNGIGDQQYFDINGKSTPRYSKEYWEQYITTLHIVYNRLRNRPAHTGTEQRITGGDDFYLGGQNPALYHAPAIFRHIVDELREKHGVVIEKEVEVE